MSFRAALRNRGFLALWIAQVVSRLGDSVHELALIWVVVSVTGDPAVLSVVVLASMLPNLVVSLPAGSLVDRWNRKHVLVVTDVVRGAAVLAIPLLGRHDLLVPVVVAVALVTGTMEAFFGPARQAIVPNLVDREHLDAANALSQLTVSASQTLYTAGGLVVGVVGAFAAFYVDAASFFLSALVLLAIPRAAGAPDAGREAATTDGPAPADRSSGASTADEPGVLADVRDGLGFVRGHRLLVPLIAVAVLVNFAGAPLGVVLPFYVDALGGGGAVAPLATWLAATVPNAGGVDEAGLAFGLVYGALFVGMFAGSVLVNVLGGVVMDQRGRVVVGSLVLSGLSLLGAATLPAATGAPLATGLAALFATGLFVGGVNVPVNTLVQAVVPDDRRGKVFAVMNVGTMAAAPVGVALAGPLVAAAGPLAVLAGEGLLVAAAGGLAATTPLLGVGREAVVDDGGRTEDVAGADDGSTAVAGTDDGPAEAA